MRFFFFNKCFSSHNTSEITTFFHSKNEQEGKIHIRFTSHTVYNLTDEVKPSAGAQSTNTLVLDECGGQIHEETEVRES